ncbi:Nucleolar protein 16 [Chamberlinius hualienensis]
MGKSAGVKRRKSRKYNYGTNRRRLWKNSKKLPHIKCDAVREAWERGKGVAKNLQEMGLVADPNKIDRIPSAKLLLKQSVQNINDEPSTERKSSKNKLRKGFVVDALVEEASKPRDTTFHVSNEIGYFVNYMVDRYGDDYKAMARDPRNHYQETPKQIKRKIDDYQVSKYLDAVRSARKEEKLSESLT